ncbi:ATP-dependent DNA helicase RecG [Ralstonia pseudosolanacearum]|uniref:ATP-dependent DNA helicase RecG n=1 Tax=Ralstonia solanacearum TaxID=305 RepID=A0AA92JQ53_RALSL|nr:ATP-dependent DNA helicase RecG [Ralstonia pseudosolanacearum]QOK90709.1 ATP-dependent DNA helicase RecG [Ralstonia pseudosolanacearum]QOK95637.1 ATP-dependent DNA helicase RecG [Ralstonia pseudosolanacearum]UWD91663.1 ATP-dependent DNA helicase RecG [Ralstonia pseudosolanacearum]CAH0444213.1 ATP-dependent DNA helicase RecG [Ralstonia pseudosolanacearum]
MPARARSATAAVPAPDTDAAPAAGPRRARAAKPADKPAAKTARPADKLAKLGLRRDVDLVLHLPMRYEDETALLTIAEAVARANTGWAAQVDGVVTRNEVAFRPRRQLVVHIADDSGELVLRFLNFYGSQVKQMAEGARLRVRGEVRGGFFGAEMVHPAVRAVAPDEPLPDRLTPVYPSTAGVAQAYLRKAILNALGRTPLPETLPDSLLHGPLASLKLMAPAEAVRLLHQPTPDVDEYSLVERTHPAWLRIKFDELLAQQLSLKRAQAARRTRSAPVLRAGGADGLLARFVAALPFKLTGAQARVWEEISADLARPYPMQRLLQGDVGSGKTVIAALAACQAIDAGRQAALMAPTELLAEQHYRKLSAWLAPLGVDIVWLAGSLKRKQKDEAAARVAAGTAQLVIGTHALIQDTVTFARLGLAVVDEQHRFGVAQRLALRGKAGGTGTPIAETAQLVPHQLMMSATPIPRTLAMTYYADLDVSAIDELPPGRTPVVTRLVNDARRDEVIERIHAAAREGRQVYWVCPLIEESEALQLQTAVETFETLSQSLAGLKVGLVHGRLPSADKAAVMSAFAGGELHVLVATTVIEVGVDVPNASLMVIEHAERFGLAQLHQLRGRVGRGTAESVCILLYQAPLSPTAKQRLQTMRETTDGFEIARRDLDIRGPGEFLGARQSGEAMLRFADLNHDAWMVEFAQGAAEQMLARFPDAVEAHLKRWLGEREHYLRV